MEQVRIDTAQNVTVSLAVAPLGARLLAATVDMALQWIVGTAVLVLLLRAGVDAAWVVVFPLMGLYPLLAEANFDGRTLGKHMLRLRVARLDGQPPTLGQYLIRALALPIDQACGLGAVVVAASQRWQRLGDLAAGTTVVRDGDRVTLEETLYRAAEREASVSFPSAVYLSDRELEAIRRVAFALRQNPGEPSLYNLANELQTRVERRLDATSELPPPAFLETVLSDYNVLTGRL